MIIPQAECYDVIGAPEKKLNILETVLDFNKGKTLTNFNKDISFQKESMKVLFSEAGDLIKKHYDEIAHYQDIPLKIDEETYSKIEESGNLKCFTARLDGKIIGYSIFMLKRNIRYLTSIQALQDVIFIDPEKRGFGMKFIKWCDDELRKLGVQVVYHHVKANHNFGPGLERMGYELIDHIYGKRLDRGI